MSFIIALVLSLQSMAAPNIPLEDNIEPPALLSQTGLFQLPITSLLPSKEMKSYEINQPLWVDHARKQRFLYIPENQNRYTHHPSLLASIS